jgi:hypothetical protein
MITGISMEKLIKNPEVRNFLFFLSDKAGGGGGVRVGVRHEQGGWYLTGSQVGCGCGRAVKLVWSFCRSL